MTGTTEVKECQIHGWQKYHPDEDCLICYYDGLKTQVLEKYPHYENNDIKLEDAIQRIHVGRRL